VNQQYVLVLNIINESGITVHTDSLPSILGAKQHSSQNINWTPTESGIFNFHLLIFKSISNPESLSKPETWILRVED
jgi:hypothetical protein